MRPRRFQTISFKLTGFFLALSLVSAAIMAVIVYVDMQATLLDQIRQRVSESSRYLAEQYEREGLNSLVGTIRRQGSIVGALEYRIEAAGGRVLAGDLPSAPREEGWATVRLPSGGVPGGDTETRALVYVTMLAGGEQLIVGEGLDRVAQARQAILKAFVIATVVVLILSIAGGTALNALFVRRLDGMAQAARSVMAGDLTRRIPVSGDQDELGWLATTINHMLDRTAALVELNRQIGADLAHDLRSPLSHLMQRLDTARLKATGVEDYENAIDGAVSDVHQVLATFNAILRIAQVEAGTRRAAFKAVDLVGILRDVAEIFGPVADDEHKSIMLAGLDTVEIVGDRELLTQLFVNLVENGIRHTPEGSRIEIRVDREGDLVRVVVADDGPGIPEGDRARVLERYARLDRSRSTPGSGLGLTLCGAIAELHEGRFALEDNGPGLRCVLRIPVGTEELPRPVPSASAVREPPTAAWSPSRNSTSSS